MSRYLSRYRCGHTRLPGQDWPLARCPACWWAAFLRKYPECAPFVRPVEPE
jgi:hypothetical protein